MQGIQAELGVEAAGEISFEVSSPGAERTLILPQDLLRFKVSKQRLLSCAAVRLVIRCSLCVFERGFLAL